MARYHCRCLPRLFLGQEGDAWCFQETSGRERGLRSDHVLDLVCFPIVPQEERSIGENLTRDGLRFQRFENVAVCEFKSSIKCLGDLLLQSCSTQTGEVRLSRKLRTQEQVTGSLVNLPPAYTEVTRHARTE